MKVKTGHAVRGAMVAMVGLAGLAGCESDKCCKPEKPGAAEFFPPDDGNRKYQQCATAQAANGATEDATLQAYHFTGAKLNSLGREKLDLMRPADPETSTVVYLNIPLDDLSAARKDAVRAYLQSQGIDEKQAAIEIGRNPNLNSPAAAGLARLSKTDATGESAEQSGMKSGMK